MRSRQLQFAAVGAVGFVVDVSALYTIIFLSDASLYVARAGSFVVAATATWWLNRRTTFREAPRPEPIGQWGRFLAANSAGGAINYALFAALVGAWPSAPLQPGLAVAAGSAAGLIFNYHLSRRFVFSR